MKTSIKSILILLVCTIASQALAQTVQIGSASGLPGETVMIPIDFTPGPSPERDVTSIAIIFSFTGLYDNVVTTPGIPLCDGDVGPLVAEVCGWDGGFQYQVQQAYADPFPTARLARINFTIPADAVPGIDTIIPVRVLIGTAAGPLDPPVPVLEGTIEVLEGPQPGYVSTPQPVGYDPGPHVMGGVSGDPVDATFPFIIDNSGEPDSVLDVDCDVFGPLGVFSIDQDAPFQIVAGIDPPVPVTVTCELDNPPGQYLGDLWCINNGNPQFGMDAVEANYPLVCNIAEQPASLTVIKIVENGTTGGTLGVGDFTLLVNGVPVTSGVPNDVAPGVPHLVSEVPEPGYVGAIGGDCNPETGEIILEPGQSATCTITNTAQQATLTVIKVVENGDTGATAVVGDFTLMVDGVPVTSGAANDVDPGLRTVSEVPVPGYTAEITGDCNLAGEVTLALGEDKTCTITNTAQQATLTVIKVVDNGPTPGPLDVADFDIQIDGGSVTSGVANDVDPGLHVVGEIAQTGYTGVISGDCDPATGEVTLGVGETKTCTITNTRESYTLTVYKVIEIEDERIFPDLFIMDANGVEGTPAGHGAMATAQVLFDDDAYIDELAGVGTDLNFWDSTFECMDVTGALVGEGDGHRYDFTMPASDVDCTIYNERKMEEVTLIKEAVQIPDGEYCFDVMMFGVSVEGPEAPCIQTSGGYGNLTGSGYVGHYQVNEIIDGPFALLSASCSNGQNPETGFDLVPGEPLTCTWVNGSALAIPVNNPWALLLLALMVLGVGWYYRPVIMRRH